MEEVAGEFAGQAKFVKVDIEDAEDVAADYSVYAVPTILFFKNGSPIDKVMGLVDKAKLKSRVTALISG